MDRVHILKQQDDGKVTSCKLGPITSIMCPDCFAVYAVRQSGMVLAAADECIDLLADVSYHIQCAHCDFSGHGIEIDPPIANAVSKLNQLGYKTTLCCSGHADDQYNNAFIKFDKEYDFKTLPSCWEKDENFIRSTINSVADSMFALNCWVHELMG